MPSSHPTCESLPFRQVVALFEKTGRCRVCLDVDATMRLEAVDA